MAGTHVAVTRAPSLVEELDRMRQRIGERAYERYRTSDGCSNPDEDWLKAEQEWVWQPAVEVRQRDGR